MRVVLVMTLALGLWLQAACSKGSGSDESLSVSKVQSVQEKNYCPHLVAKFGECANGSSIKNRFRFSQLKHWIYEDCEKARKEDPQLYARLYGCISKDCDGLNNCLEQIMKKRPEKDSE